DPGDRPRTHRLTRRGPAAGHGSITLPALLMTTVYGSYTVVARRRVGSAWLVQPLPRVALSLRGQVFQLRPLRLAALPTFRGVLLPSAAVAAPAPARVDVFGHHSLLLS